MRDQLYRSLAVVDLEAMQRIAHVDDACIDEPLDCAHALSLPDVRDQIGVGSVLPLAHLRCPQRVVSDLSAALFIHTHPNTPYLPFPR